MRVCRKSYNGEGELIFEIGRRMTPYSFKTWEKFLEEYFNEAWIGLVIGTEAIIIHPKSTELHPYNWFYLVDE